MVSVIIATKNREKSLKKCLASIKKQSYRDFEVMVIKSKVKSQKSKVKFKSRKLRTYYYNDKSLADARDFGWRKARGEIVVYIDDDCEVTKNWLKEIVLTFKDQKAGGVSGPTIVRRDEMKNRDVFMFQSQKSKVKSQNYKSKVKSFFWNSVGWFYNNVILEGRWREVGRITRSGMWTMGANFYKITNYQLPITNVDYLEACNMAFRRDLIEKAGGFDLNFKGTSEWCEVDLAMRIKTMGYKLVFNPKAVLYHHVSREGVFNERVNAKVRMENFLRYFRKHGKMNWRFIACVLFWDGYWVYKFLTTRNYRWLLGLTVFQISSILNQDEK